MARKFHHLERYKLHVFYRLLEAHAQRESKRQLEPACVRLLPVSHCSGARCARKSPDSIPRYVTALRLENVEQCIFEVIHSFGDAGIGDRIVWPLGGKQNAFFVVHV